MQWRRTRRWNPRTRPQESWTFALGLALMGGIALWLSACGSQRSTSATTERIVEMAVQPPAPRLERSASEILASVQEEVRKVACCTVHAVDFHDGVLRLEGSAKTEEERQAIWKAAGRIAEVKELQGSILVPPAPFLQAIGLLAPFRSSSGLQDSSTSIRPQKGCGHVYYDREQLVIDIVVPQPNRYIYADYYVADGEVVAHLLPSAVQPNNRLDRATATRLGEKGGHTQLRVQPPFGVELLTVISSLQPLLDQPQLLPEGVTSYLGKLRQVLAAKKEAPSDISADYCLIMSKADQEEQGATEEASQSSPPSPFPPPGTSVEASTSPIEVPHHATHEGHSSSSVEFSDLSGFDTKLSSTLKNASAEVTVQFASPITVNTIPQRLDKWLSTVEHGGGAVALLEDLDNPGPQYRFLGSLAIALAIGAYEAIRDSMLYSPAKHYNATVYYQKGKGTVTRVVFSPRER